MQYMLMLYVNEAGFAQATPDQQAQGVAAYKAFTEALKNAGALSAVGRLQPSPTATTLRLADNGKPKVLNGPYAETKEQFGGYYVIDVPDLDAALSWAARCPTADHGTVEVRPLFVPPPA